MAATRNKPSPERATRLRRVLAERLGGWLDGRGPEAAGRHVVVGLSGGKDSVALLHAVSTLRDALALQVSALHVHHGLSPHADDWVAFAENFCKSLTVPLQVVRVTVPARSPHGLEGAARLARYRAFAQCRADLLLLAHHRDDQAETLLFNLLRGAGVHGAAAMPMLRLLGPSADAQRPSLPLGRPWLDVSRADIEEYVAALGLRHIHDESNDDVSFRRNHLRHEVLPLIARRHPAAAGTLAGAATRFGEAAQLLDALADIDLAEAASGNRLDWRHLRMLDEARQKNALRRWLSLAGMPCGNDAGLSEFLRQCQEGRGDSSATMIVGRHALRRWQNGIYRLPARMAEPPASVVWRGESAVSWGNGTLQMRPVVGCGLRQDAIAGCVQIKARSGGERIRLRPDGPTREVRQLLQEMGIPPWVRRQMPFCWVDGQLAAVGGLGVAAGFLAAGGEIGRSFEWQPDPSVRAP